MKTEEEDRSRASKKKQPTKTKSSGPVKSKNDISAPPDLIKKPARKSGGNGRAPINSNVHQQFVQASSGRYTPEAIKQIYNLPITTGELPADVGGRYYFGSRDVFNNGSGRKIELPSQFYGNEFDPINADNVFRHEYAHYFDDLNNTVDSNSGIASEFSANGLSDFPGIGSTPMVTTMSGEPWGGPREAYARVAENPSRYRGLRWLYPQFTDEAFSGRNRFNIPIPPPPLDSARIRKSIINAMNSIP